MPSEQYGVLPVGTEEREMVLAQTRLFQLEVFSEALAAVRNLHLPVTLEWQIARQLAWQPPGWHDALLCWADRDDRELRAECDFVVPHERAQAQPTRGFGKQVAAFFGLSPSSLDADDEASALNDKPPCGAVSLFKDVHVGVTEERLLCLAAELPDVAHVVLQNGPTVSDAVVDALSQHCLLRHVGLWNCPLVSDYGALALAQRCHLLQSVCLAGTRITDVSLCAIADHCPQLKMLHASGPRISDRGIVAIAHGCPSLEALRLEITRVTDVAMFAIAFWCTVLQRLSLERCTLVTDDGIVAIAQGCRCLRRVYLRCLPVSSKSLALLKSTCPDIEGEDIEPITVQNMALVQY
eukprot:TRINITY_DN45615_c0_g1_i1.p1 TRINITY_DN45615_c0_g1~~TRINITY_DN45615_c0_g1_i1.p1  ORF type:complete len:359 (+),score=48.01 TRINITY_DN45615_c0_g1_i1:22-1077(+)